MQHNSNYLYLTIAGALSMLLLFSACESPSEVTLSVFDEDNLGDFEFVMKNDDFFTSEEEILSDPDNDFVSRIVAENSEGEEIVDVRRVARRILDIERSFAHEFVDDTVAIVTMTRTLEVRVWVEGLIQPQDPGVPEIITFYKDFIETATRKAKFVKVANTGTAEDDWKLVEISLLEGGTSERDFDITQVNIKFGEDRSYEFDNPLDTFMRIGLGPREVPVVMLSQFRSQGFQIEITVQSTNEEPEILFLRHGGKAAGPGDMAGYMRRVMLSPSPDEGEFSESDGVFTRTYVIDWNQVMHQTHANAAQRGETIRRGRFSTVVEAVSYETLYDTEAPVQTKYWGVPFIIE